MSFVPKKNKVQNAMKTLHFNFSLIDVTSGPNSGLDSDAAFKSFNLIAKATWHRIQPNNQDKGETSI